MTTNTPIPELQVFTFSENAKTIEVIMQEDAAWFLAKDVCDALGLENVTKALENLDEDERLTLPVVRAGQSRKMNFASESGVYALVFQSRKPQAKSFRKWVTSEVLPQIRKTGSYSINGAKYKRTACHTGTGYQAKGFYTNYIDYRSCSFNYILYNNREVQTLQYQGITWYSIRNFLSSVHCSTKAGQWASNLNAAKPGLCKKFWLFGNTVPAHFTQIEGLEMIKRSLRVTTHPMHNLELPFPSQLPIELDITETNPL